MLKRVLFFIAGGAIVLNLCGCFALLAGGAAGAGTSVWLSGKLTQQLNANYERTVRAAEAGLTSLNLPLTKVSRDANVTQIKSVNPDGKEIWVDVHRTTETSSKVEVRVGGFEPDKASADRILKAIQSHL